MSKQFEQWFDTMVASYAGNQGNRNASEFDGMSRETLSIAGWRTTATAVRQT